MWFIKSVLWLGAAAALVAAPVASALAGDPDTKDVTITVVSDPEQLNERVNRIALPAADDEQSEAAAAQRSKAGHAKQDDDTHERAARDAQDSARDAGNNAKNDAGNVTQDTRDAQHEGPDHSQGQGGS